MSHEHNISRVEWQNILSAVDDISRNLKKKLPRKAFFRPLFLMFL